MSAYDDETFEQDRADEPAPAAEQAPPRNGGPLVPSDTIAGRALVAVIGIMTFLAALTLGAVVLVRGAATEWQSQIAREVTIQIRPAEGRDSEAAVSRAADIARSVAGVAEVRPYSKEEAARLLEPWLGTGLALDDLPVPRVIVVKIAADAAPDLAGLRKRLAEDVPGASVDDHRGWIDRMRAMARTAVVVGLGILALVLAATMLSVSFATRGAMASNRPIVEVLHFIGARDSYIAGEFQRHFVWLGLKGGALGGGLAVVLFAVAGLLADRFKGTAAEDQVGALFGSFAVGPEGYAAIVGLVVLASAVAAGTSRWTVQQTLKAME